VSENERPTILERESSGVLFSIIKSKGEYVMKLEDTFKTLGLPLALVAVIVALLAWAGLTLEQLYVIAAALVGLQLLISFLIDVLKYAGVVNDGTSGKWSATFNLITLVGVAIWLKFFPAFDLYAVDKQLLELAKALIVVFAYITQIVGTKAVHTIAASYKVAPTFAKS
jgi:hypothetical protein